MADIDMSKAKARRAKLRAERAALKAEIAARNAPKEEPKAEPPKDADGGNIFTRRTSNVDRIVEESVRGAAKRASDENERGTR